MAKLADATIRIAEKVGPDLAGAVALIQQSARDAAPAQVVNIEAADGLGGKLTVPVLILRDADGGTDARPLLNELTQGAALAKQLREANAEGPARREGTAKHQALSSFVEHANRFKGESSALWADPARRLLVSVLDYHPKGHDSAPRWGRHRGEYPCPTSEAWAAWGGAQGLTLTQEAFAELLDRRDRELVAGAFKGGPRDGRPAPSPADLVTLAGSLETFSRSTCKKERNGQQTRLVFTEENGTSVAAPEGFLIRIRVFEDGAPETLEVRLRVTVEEGGKAKFHVRIHEASELLRQAFAGISSLAGAQTELPTFQGTPE